MEKINCLVVDDESMGRKLLEENVRQIPFLNLVGSCKNAFDAMEKLQENSVDLIFLDIQMPGMLGTQFLQTLINKPLVIFVSAYDHYAVESYEFSAVDYLMKPVSLERFTLAAYKAFDLLKLKNPIEKNVDVIQSTVEKIEPLEDFFFVNVEYALVRISIPQITHVEGLKDYVKIYLEGEKRPILTKTTMKSMESKVRPHLFMRVHKSYIVNIRKIELVKQQRIKIGLFDIPISDSHAADLIEKLNFTRPS